MTILCLGMRYLGMTVLYIGMRYMGMTALYRYHSSHIGILYTGILKFTYRYEVHT